MQPLPTSPSSNAVHNSNYIELCQTLMIILIPSASLIAEISRCCNVGCDPYSLGNNIFSFIITIVLSINIFRLQRNLSSSGGLSATYWQSIKELFINQNRKEVIGKAFSEVIDKAFSEAFSEVFT